MGALTGLRVLDLSRILAGPWCSQILADLGAEVIKVERPQAGDDTRMWGPPWLQDNQGHNTHESAYYLSANRNKHSVAIDLASPEGQALIVKMVQSADVLIENYKAGSLSKYGLDYASLAQVNPRLVYCSITGFGQNGPRAQQPGYDFIVQGMGGMMSVTGERDDLPGGGPQKAGLAFADLTTGLYAAIAIQAALLSREKTGEGQHIDLALLDTQVASLSVLAMNYLTSGHVPGRFGNAHANIVPYQVFKAAEGEFIIACGNDGQFAALCQSIGLTALAQDSRFQRNAGRVEHREVLTQRLAQHFMQQPAWYWVNCIDAVGVPVGMINDLQQALNEEQVQAREMVVTMKHALRDDYQSIGSPMKLSKTPVQYHKAPPCLGEDTDQVLAEFLSANEISELKARGIIQQRAS
jgi:crotonobetainyl-CoA:carnitine CoA-transferase CaiB-like acyl-CoA transferase